MSNLRHFFAKRYGADALSAALIVLAGLILATVLLFGGRFAALLSLIPLSIAVLRILSCDRKKRERENAAFVSFFLGLKGNLRLAVCRIRDRRTHIYFRCPCCHRVLRVAQAQGEIQVACPNCRTVSRLGTGERPTEQAGGQNRP